MKRFEGVFTVFVAVLMLCLAYGGAHAQETETCFRNSKGDVICPPQGGSYLTTPPIDTSGVPGIINSGNPIFKTPIGQGLLSDVNDLFSSLACGQGGFNLDLSEYLNNRLTLEISLSIDPSGIDFKAIVQDACSQAERDQGSGGDMNIEGGTCAERIASSAREHEGYSTAHVEGTDGGNLACAWAVSTMLNEAGAGYGGGQVTLGTQALSDGLEADACYEVVDTGYITADEAVNLQPGDILVTPTSTNASQSDIGCVSSYGDRCNSGHTGIYTGNGEIVSNGSKGFEGAAAGISQNYTVDKWNGATGGGTGRGVIPRNVPNSKVFRNVCDDCGGGTGSSAGTGTGTKSTTAPTTTSSKPGPF